MRDRDTAIFDEFMKQINRESDRGLALIGAAFVDEKLADTLKAFFAVDAHELLHGKNAALGNFSSRIEICYALGLIEDLERHDLDYIRKIRNEFAHKVLSLSFPIIKLETYAATFYQTYRKAMQIIDSLPDLNFKTL